MLNICSSVQDHNQSTIHRDSDWTSHRAKEIYLKLKASEEMRLKNCVWSNGSEEELLKTRHQKRGHQKQWSFRSIFHQKPLHQSWQRTVYEVYGHELCNHHLCIFCLHIKTKITVTWLQSLFLLLWNGFEISSS